MLVAAAICGEVELRGLDINSMQGDKAILDALDATGARISIADGSLTVSNMETRPFEFDATDCPDLFPPLAVLASCCRGRSAIKGLHRLKYKESDRGLVLQQELRKTGADIQLDQDVMVIKGIARLNAAAFDAHNDHRIAMACGIAAMASNGNSSIAGAEAVNKSYPAFWQHLKELNATVSLNQQP